VSADRDSSSGRSDAARDDLGASRAVSAAGALPAGFAASFARLGEIARFLDGEDAASLEHSELESRLELDGRELLRTLFEDHLALRALREQRADMVLDSSGVAHRAVERGHERGLQSVFGEVTVSRLAYRARGEENLHLADAALNLPEERASHGVRRLAAVECARGSFDDALGSVRERTGVSLGKQQLLDLAARAAVDFDAFYAARARPSADVDGEPGSECTEAGEQKPSVLVLSADGKGIVMRPEALRAQTAKAAARASPKLKTRLSRGEKANRKRIAEIGAVYEIASAPRTAAEVLAPTAEKTEPAPRAKDKWVTASIVCDAAQVIGDVFAEAERRDPAHERTWVALVDGNCHQIDRIRKEAKARNVKVTILIDLIHVLEYLWSACWCFFDEGDPDAEKWVHEKALAVLEGNAGIVAAAIRRKATTLKLDPEQRKSADRTADYLLNKRAHLDYPTALAAGWPIATGIIEGACRHLVKDRMDITGARWGLDGAEAILKLRALRSNNDFDEYWTYHRAQEHQRVHQSRYAHGVIPTPVR
jgi:hypothetical protein